MARWRIWFGHGPCAHTRINRFFLCTDNLSMLKLNNGPILLRVHFFVLLCLLLYHGVNRLNYGKSSVIVHMIYLRRRICRLTLFPLLSNGNRVRLWKFYDDMKLMAMESVSILILWALLYVMAIVRVALWHDLNSMNFLWIWSVRLTHLNQALRGV